MAKINQIQNALKELDGGAFQKLADLYLLRKGYPHINSVGSVVGSNKVRKGTPDTLITTIDGKYIFGESTTISPNKLYDKFCDDIAKCLDENKTKIAVSKIQEIVLCYTSELSVENIDQLREQCQNVGVNINLYGLEAISYDLLATFPSIAKDYLGIEVDTGQIVPLDKFIDLYEKNKLATTLQTDFHFRGEEKNNLLSLIQDNNLVIISGQAGVGKSRIAIECYRQFIKTNTTYKAYCIFNQGIDLFEDIKSYFSDSGDFLIFVDDANRVSGFQYIVQLLQTKRSDQNFKIIVTVRDYALDKIRKTCQPIGTNSEIIINKFTDKEIKKLLQDAFDINHHLYLERIVDIAQGNPRLAVMAAQIAKDNDTLESIRDISELYDKYYSSIKSDLDALEDVNTLKVAGIVAFFRNVDRTNDDLMLEIKEIFNISAENFWEASKKLHEMEVLDMFEDEVVKISDQVLSTYLFYLVFFKEKLIDFSSLINNKLFPRYKHRLIDAINPILDTFNFEEVKKIMESAVNKIWVKTQESNESDFQDLIDVFYFLKPTETLLYVKEKIDSINTQEISIDEIEFKENSNSSLPKFLLNLLFFRYSEEDRIEISLDLFLRYAEKRPLDTPKIVDLFIKYSFERDSYCYGYYFPHAVVDKILEYSNSGNNEHFARIFIALAKKFLHTHFDGIKPNRGNKYYIIEFDLVASQQLFDLHEKILSTLFSLYEHKKYQQYILQLLFSHSQSGFEVSIGDIVEYDSKLISPFFAKNLDSSNLYHCIIVQQYLKFLKRFNIELEENLNVQFKSPEYLFYDLLTNKLERVELRLDCGDKYREYKRKKIAKLTLSYSKEDYDRIFHQLLGILAMFEGHSKWQISQGILSIFEELSIRNPDLFSEVIEHYLEQGDYLEIDPWWIVFSILDLAGVTKAFNIITLPDYPSKHRWLFHYYQHLPENDIKQEQIDALRELYKIAEYKYFIGNNDYLLKYENIERGFIADIVKIIIERTNTAPEFAYQLISIFNRHTEINKKLKSLFSDNYTLLEDSYMAIDRVEQSPDSSGASFSVFLDNDHSFIDRYLQEKFSQRNYLSRHHDSRDYSFIWLRDDCMDIIQRITSIIYEYYCKNYYVAYYGAFFTRGIHPQTNTIILEKQDQYLLKEIDTRFSDTDYIRFLFSIIVEFSPERKLLFYKAFLDKNKNFDAFKKLRYDSTSIWCGSAVPMLQGKINFYEKIAYLCNSVELLKHRSFIEQRINALRHEIQDEKKRDFTEL